MKKKLIIIILILLVLGIIISIVLLLNNNKEIESFNLNKEYYSNNELININKKELEKLEEDEKSFVVFVYLPGCSSCAEFSEILDSFMTTNNITVYSIEIKYAKETSIGKKIKYAPSFIIYKNGKIVSYLDASKDEDKPYYQDVDKFTSWFTKYVNIKK